MGVDIVTEYRNRSPRGRAARWVRNCIVTLGLTALLALSYHSANGAVVGAASAQTSNHSHTGAELAGAQIPADAGARPSAPGLPPAANGGRVQPGPADAADPANRQQTSLESAAAREHPIGTGSAPQGPPPQLREKTLPSQVFKGATAGGGGCLKAYGDDGQCLPVIPPSLSQHVHEMKAAGKDPNAMKHSWSCSEVRKYFKDGLAVRQAGNDPQNLDTNSDGKACAAGDG